MDWQGIAMMLTLALIMGGIFYNIIPRKSTYQKKQL